VIPKRLLDAFPLLSIGRRLALWLGLVAVYGVADWLAIYWWNIRLFSWGATAELINGILLGLLMTFRNRVAYERWWEGRRLWGQLTNDCRNLAGKLAAFLPAEVLARSPVAALLSGFPEALKRHLRGQGPRLQEIPGFEKESAAPAHVPSYLADCLYQVVAGWVRDGHLEGTTLLALDPHLRGLLDVCGGCERILQTPVSPSYKALLRTCIAGNILFAPWYTMTEIGFWGLPVFLVVCFFVLGVELIDTAVEEPFGTEREDLDLDRYCQTIRDAVRMSLPADPAAE
jgi:ion channel-forming bestrophin family protein